MRKRTIDKLLQAAIVEQAAEQGELWDREPVLEPIPEESQKRFDAALYGEPPKQTGAEDFFGQPAPKPAPEPKRRRVLAFALTGVSLAAVVLVVGLMIGVSVGEKGIKPDVLTPVHPDAQSTDAPPAGAGVHPADAPAPGLAEPTEPEEPLPTVPAETSTPAPEGMPLELTDDLPEIKTVTHPWQGYDCLIPEGFVSAHESDQEFISITSEMNDRNMIQLAYELEPTETLEGWDSDVFSEQHLQILLSKIGVPESQYADFSGHSVRTVENGVVCYHLYNRSQKVYACLARVLSDEKNSLIAVGMTLGEYGIGEFDSVVNAFVKSVSKNSPEAIVGTWILKAMESEDESQSGQIAIVNALIAAGRYEATYTFAEGGDGLAYWNIQGEKQAQVFTYTIDGDQLTFSGETMTFEIDGDQLTLQELGITMRFVRRTEDTEGSQEAAEPGESGTKQDLYGKSKTFSGKGYQITLTDRFSEQKSEMGFDSYYTADFGAVMIKIEPFSLNTRFADETLKEYLQDVIRNNNTDAQPEERDGLVFYRYRRNGICGWNFAMKGEDAFYLVQFMCREADESEFTDLFFAFAKSMTITKSDNASNE